MWESLKKRVFGLGASEGGDEGNYEQVPVIHAKIDLMSGYTQEYVREEEERRQLAQMTEISRQLAELLKFIKGGEAKRATPGEKMEIDMQVLRIQRDVRNHDYSDIPQTVKDLKDILDEIQKRNDYASGGDNSAF